jgi:hypothetical protein
VAYRLALLEKRESRLFVTGGTDERLTEIPLISMVDDHSLARAAIEDVVRSLGFSARTFASAESFLQSSSMGKRDACKCQK